LGQSTAAQQKTMHSRPQQQEASFPGLKGRIRVNMDSDKKEGSFEKPKLLPTIAMDHKEMIASDGPMKGTTDALMQRSTFEDSNRHYNPSRENSGRISEYKNRKLVHKLSDAIIEEPKPYKAHSKNLSDVKLISGTTRQRKLWRKSTLTDENKLGDMMSSKVTKQDITDDERTSARYVPMHA